MSATAFNHGSVGAPEDRRPSLRKRMTRIVLGILMAMLLLSPGLWVSKFTAQRTSSDVSPKSPTANGMNADPGKPLSNNNSIRNSVHDVNVDLKSLFAGHPGLSFTNDLDLDPVDFSTEASAPDTDHFVFLGSAVTVLTATLLNSTP